MSNDNARRNVLKGVAVTTALALLPEAKAGNARRWDHEVDLVVVGTGSGMVAALVAAAQGLKVLMLEKHPGIGGTTLVSGGILWIPNNNVQKREGIEDSREASSTYLRHLAFGQADGELIEAFLDHGPAMLDFIERHTRLRWRVSTRLGRIGDYHPEWKGSNVRGRSVEPERSGVERAGGLLIEHIYTALQAHRVDIMTATPARRLIARESGDGQEVIGIEAEYQGKPLRIRARRGVLLASGGFERNEEMKRHFLRGPSPYTLGCETNTGDGIHMGMALGADLRNMNEVWGMSVYKGDAELNGKYRGGASLMHPGGAPGGMLVNRHGERFCNEGGDYDSRWRTFHTWENWGDLGYRNLPAFHICDRRQREERTLFGRSKDEPIPDWAVEAPTLEALARKLGIDPSGLAATVARFNTFATHGADPDFHRGESHYDRFGQTDPRITLRPLVMEGPFFGAEVCPAELGTCGGLRVDGQARVIDVFGRPIVGLYASGNTSGVGGPGTGYGGGGGTLGPAFTFAYIAGKQVVATKARRA